MHTPLLPPPGPTLTRLRVPGSDAILFRLTVNGDRILLPIAAARVLSGLLTEKLLNADIDFLRSLPGAGKGTKANTKGRR